MTERLQAEQAVLAALMTRPDRWWMELQDLSAFWFSDPAHKQIAQAIIRLRDHGRRVHWMRVMRAVGWGERSMFWRARHHQLPIEQGSIERLAKAIGTDANTSALVARLRQSQPRRTA